jgi:hypothetical protein
LAALTAFVAQESQMAVDLALRDRGDGGRRLLRESADRRRDQ